MDENRTEQQTQVSQQKIEIESSRDNEEKIPVFPESFFIVDCPSLHFIPESYLDPRRLQISYDGLWAFQTQVFCPQCRQLATKTRKLPSSFFAVDSVPALPTSRSPAASRPGIGPRLGLTGLMPSAAPTPAPSPHSNTTPLRHVASHTDSFFSDPSTTSPSPSPLPPPRSSPAIPPVASDIPLSAAFRPYSPVLPEVVPFDNPRYGEGFRRASIAQQRQLQQHSQQTAELPATSSAKPASSRKLGNLFKRSATSKDSSHASKAEKTVKPSNKPSSSAKSIGSHDSSGSALPKFMSFCFSATGKTLLIWKKESEMLVRIEVETLGGRAIQLGDLLPAAEGERGVHIHHAVEGDGVLAVILSHNRELLLVVLHESGLAEHSSVQRLDAQQHMTTCLAIAPNNTFVAVCLGVHVLLLHCAGGAMGTELQWGVTLTVGGGGFGTPGSVKFQTASFAPDSSALVVATQKMDRQRSQDDDAVYTYVWPCRAVPGDPLQLQLCKMPTDTLGLTAIQWLPSFSMGFITGMASTKYNLFLAPSNDRYSASTSVSANPQTPSKVLEYRIRCSCICPSPNSHILYFLDVTNKIFKVDMHTRHIRHVADIHASRGALKPTEEHAALSASADGRVRIFWRQGAGLWQLEVREGSSPIKTNLRALWQDSIGGE